MNAKGTRPVPTNLDSWPGVTDLINDYKHILHVLWSSPSPLVSVVGVGQAGIIERLTSATRLDEPVVLEVLRELERRSLVVIDEETREIGIRRWCSWHEFGGKWARAAVNAYSQIQSPKIKGVLAKEEGVKSLFSTKTTTSSPTATATSTATSSLHAVDAPGVDAVRADKESSDLPGKLPRKTKRLVYGVECWTDEDLQMVESLVRQHGDTAIQTAAKEIEGQGLQPLPSRVLSLIKRKNHENNIPSCERQQQPHRGALDPAAVAAGRAALGFELPIDSGGSNIIDGSCRPA